MSKLFGLLTAITVFSFFPSHAQNKNNLSLKQKERLDSLFDYMESQNIFNGGVLVAENDHVVYIRCSGYAVKETNTPFTDTTLVNTASVSKSFTAVAVLQLVQRRKVDLQAPVNHYLRNFPYPKIKIHHLLSHTSGLPRPEDFEQSYIRAHPKEILTNEVVYTHLLALKDTLKFQPGGQFAYNNLNYLLLAMIVEKVAGLPFPVYMRKNIFLPAGMKRTFVRNPLEPNTPRYMIPSLYETEYVNVDSLHPFKYSTSYNENGTSGSSNVVSTLQDLFLFDRAISNGKLVPKALLQKAFQPLVLNNGSTFFMGGSKRSYGLGWNTLYNPYGDTCVFHDGHIPGIFSMFFKNLTKNQTIILLENAETPAFFQKLNAIYNIINNRPAVQLLKTGNKKSVGKAYVKVLMEKGPDQAALTLMELRADTANYFLNELELNSIGYDLHFKGESRVTMKWPWRS
jgi:CubicO group peptidase (beta-lactamase class C family)